MSRAANSAVRAAALSGAAVTAALAAWVLGSARAVLTEGGDAATALSASNAALVWSQVLAVLLIGYAAVAGRSLRERLLALAALAATPLPVAGILLAVGAVTLTELVLGQLMVALCAVLVALSGLAAERLMQPGTRWLTPALQVASLAAVLFVQRMLLEAG